MTTDRSIVVSGEAEVVTMPDRAVLLLGVERRNKDQHLAQQQVDDIVRDFLGLCKTLEISDQSVDSTRLTLQPEYDWNNTTRKRKLIAYLVRRTLEVSLDEVAQLGVLMDQATAMGINQSGAPRLESSRKVEIKREALALAAEDARLNAIAAARPLDARIGKVRRIQTTNLIVHPTPRGARPEMMRTAATKADDGGADTYNPGEIRISAEITVEFDLVAN